jgi:hypothetical protein
LLLLLLLLILLLLLWKAGIAAVEICRADCVAPVCPQGLALSSPTDGGRSVGVVGSQTKATELLLLLLLLLLYVLPYFVFRF